MLSPLFDPAVAYGMLMQPQFIYPLIAVLVGYGAWDRFFRAAFRIHVCIEEGESLQEIKSFKLPLARVGTTIQWVVKKSIMDKQRNQTNTEEGKAYIIDAKDVLFKDRFNKRHIIQPYDQVFALHPYSDIKGKVAFMSLATAKADTLFQVVSKHGFFAKVLSLKQKLGTNMGTGMLVLILIAGIAVGIEVAPLVSHYTNPPSPTNSTIITITQTITSVVSTIGGKAP